MSKKVNAGSLIECGQKVLRVVRTTPSFNRDEAVVTAITTELEFITKPWREWREAGYTVRLTSR